MGRKKEFTKDNRIFRQPLPEAGWPSNAIGEFRLTGIPHLWNSPAAARVDQGQAKVQLCSREYFHGISRFGCQ
jgi:hypothetical protein